MGRTTMRGGKRVIDDPLFRARLAALEAELATIDLTNLRFLREVKAGKQSALHAPVLKIISSEMQRAISELQLRALGTTALPFIPSDTATNRPHQYAAENYCNMRKTTIYAGRTKFSATSRRKASWDEREAGSTRRRRSPRLPAGRKPGDVFGHARPLDHRQSGEGLAHGAVADARRARRLSPRSRPKSVAATGARTQPRWLVEYWRRRASSLRSRFRLRRL